MSLSLVVPPSPREALALQSFSAVVVTGGSSGIGKSFIELGLKLKPDLFFCNLSRRSPPKKITDMAGGNLTHCACDLTRPAEVARAAATVADLLAQRAPTGRVLLINNSGFGTFAPFVESDLQRELETIDVNVRALVQLTGLMLPLLQARGGAVMNIASTMSFQPSAFAATYSASKAFVLNWTVALNEELRGTGVRALAVCPGTTRTEFFHEAGVGGADRAPFAMDPDQVARIALRALGRGRAQVVAGWKNKLMTVIGAHTPKPLAARVSGGIVARLRGLERPKVK